VIATVPPGLPESLCSRLSFPVAFRPFTEAEEEATTLYIFEHALFPGLFQTEPYASTVLATYPHVTAERWSEA
jgi:hypothetical protein